MTDTENAIETGLDVESIHPRHGEKYSKNLYTWLTSKLAHEKLARVYSPKSSNDLWIGFFDEGWFHGSMMMRVLCSGKAAHSHARRVEGMVEVEGLLGALR